MGDENKDYEVKSLWWEFEQDCTQMHTDNAYHWDWFIFKMPTAEFGNAFEDTTPEDAAYIGWWESGNTLSVGGPQNTEGHQTGVSWNKNGNGNIPTTADERLHCLTVDEFGFIYVGGHTTHTDTSSGSVRVLGA